MFHLLRFLKIFGREAQGLLPGIAGRTRLIVIFFGQERVADAFVDGDFVGDAQCVECRLEFKNVTRPR